MTIILLAAGFFAIGITVILLFRSAVRADDELDRRWEEVVGRRSAGGEAPSVRPPAPPDPAASQPPSVRPPAPPDPAASQPPPAPGGDA